MQHGRVERALTAIGEGELVTLTRDLVTVPSHEEVGTQEVAEELRQRLAAEGIATELQPLGFGKHTNLLARIGPVDRPPVLLLNGHLDTVAPTPGQEAPWVEGARVYGRGSVDMKGAVAAMALAMIALSRIRTPLRGGVCLAGVAGEEIGGIGTRAFLDKGGWAEMAVVGEPTGMQPVIAHKGVEWIKVELAGRAAHASKPSAGANAVTSAAAVVHALEELGEVLSARTPHSLLGTPTLSVGTIRGGVVPNVVPDCCVITIDRRRLPGETGEDAREEVRRAVERALRGREGIVARVGPASERRHMGPMETHSDHPLVLSVQALLDGMRLPTAVRGVPYGTDGAWLSDRGIPTVVVGPGDIAQAHGRDEYVEIAQLECALRFYVSLIIELCVA